jgi:NACalpha-BTF3-like transcription factor
MGLFTKMYGASKELVEEAKRPLVKNKMVRMYAAAKDSAESQKIDAEENIRVERMKFNNMDINAILRYKATIVSADETIKAIEEEAKIMFEEETK